MRRSALEINPDLYKMYEKTGHLKKKTVPMKKSENVLAKAGDTRRLQEARILDFFIGSVFFIAIRLGICGGGSAPHFAFWRERRLKVDQNSGSCNPTACAFQLG